MKITYDCPLCDTPASSQEEIAFLDADACNLLPGNHDLELVQFRCEEGHLFYINKPDFDSFHNFKLPSFIQ